MPRQRSNLAGFLNVNKPAGFTSHDVVARIRRWSGQRQVGHGGTLDPQATGVLPVALGFCTRLLEYIPEPKVYEAEVVFGASTDTYDAEGTVVAEADASGVTGAAIEAALAAFIGEAVLQQPPAYSAVKLNGQRSYELARAGAAVAPAVRSVRVYGIALLSFEAPAARLRVVCGKGMYVRSLAHDLGQALGCGAHLAGLVRTHNGPFGIHTAVPLEDLEGRLQAAPRDAMLPAGFPFPHWPSVRLTDDKVARVLTGSPLFLTVAELWPPKPLTVAGVPVPPATQHCLAYGRDGQLLAVLDRVSGSTAWRPSKVFPPGVPDEPLAVLRNT